MASSRLAKKFEQFVVDAEVSASSKLPIAPRVRPIHDPSKAAQYLSVLRTAEISPRGQVDFVGYELYRSVAQCHLHTARVSTAREFLGGSGRLPRFVAKGMPMAAA